MRKAKNNKLRLMNLTENWKEWKKRFVRQKNDQKFLLRNIDHPTKCYRG